MSQFQPLADFNKSLQGIKKSNQTLNRELIKVARAVESLTRTEEKANTEAKKKLRSDTRWRLRLHKSIAGLESTMGEVGSSIGSLVLPTTILGVGFSLLSKSLANQTAETQFLSRNLGVSRQSIDGLRYAFIQEGGSEGSADALYGAIQRARLDPSQRSALASLGVTEIEDKSNEQIMQAVIKGLSPQEGRAKSVQLKAMETLNLPMEEFGFLLEGASKQLNGWIKDYKTLNPLRDDEAQILIESNRVMNKFSEIVGITFSRIIISLTPALNKFYESIGNFLMSDTMQKGIDGLSNFIKSLDVESAIEGILSAFNVFRESLASLADAIKFIISPIDYMRERNAESKAILESEDRASLGEYAKERIAGLSQEEMIDAGLMGGFDKRMESVSYRYGSQDKAYTTNNITTNNYGATDQEMQSKITGNLNMAGN